MYVERSAGERVREHDVAEYNGTRLKKRLTQAVEAHPASKAVIEIAVGNFGLGGHFCNVVCVRTP
jgi:hypothetical protein